VEWAEELAVLPVMIHVSVKKLTYWQRLEWSKLCWQSNRKANSVKRTPRNIKSLGAHSKRNTGEMMAVVTKR